MRLTITRTGGLLPTLRPAVALELDQLDDATREAVCSFLEPGQAPAAEVARRGPMVYVFELVDPGQGAPTAERRCGYGDVPEALRPLLPGPT